VLQHGEVNPKESNVKKTVALISSIAALTLAACGSSTPAPAPTKVSLGTATAGTYTVELLADQALATGGNAVYARVTVTATGAAVTNAAATLRPMMDMGTTQHSCPVTGPFEYDATEGLYLTGVIFQMAGTWTATVTLTPSGGAPLTASYTGLVVADTGAAKTFTVGTGMAAVKYVISMDFVGAPVVGLNPILVALYSTTDMGMTFTPVIDASFALEPWMPSMGHGSPGSVNPVHVADGVYLGKVSFSMTGAWETRVTVSRGGAALVSVPAQPIVFLTTF
jgi:hypothetical protein